MGNRAALAKVLCASVRGDAVVFASERGSDLAGLAELAIAHGVAGSVSRYQHELPNLAIEDRKLLGVHALQNRGAHARVGADLEYLAPLLDALGLPWLVVKGPAVAATLYSPPEERAAGDLDVLVEPNDFARVIAALERAGHAVDDANWPLIRRLEAGQLHMMLPRGTPLDLHWHVLFKKSERGRYPLTTGQLFAHRRAVTIGTVTAATLDAEDTLVHLAFHAASEGGDRLSWLADVARAAAVDGLDWDRVIGRATGWHMQLPVGTMLQRAAHQLGAPVPSPVTTQLLPGAWRTAMRAVDAAFPVARTHRRLGTPASLLAKSSTIEPTPLRATGAAVSGLARRALVLAQTGDATRADHANPAALEARLSYEAAFSEEDRAAYFSAVAASR